ncbi:MAG: hypothetical protein ACRC4M_01985 [Mycoplasma sp.]
MLRKNKISEALKRSKTTTTKETKFDSLSELNRRLSENKINRKFFIAPYQAGLANVKDKYSRYSTYVMSHKNFAIKWSYIAIVITLFILASLLAFLPYQATSVGIATTNVTNFWAASLKSTGKVAYSLTSLAWVFFSFLMLTLIATPFYRAHLKKLNKWRTYSSPEVARSSFWAFVLLIFLFLLLVSAFIWPPSSKLLTMSQKYYNYIAVINDTNASELVRSFSVLKLFRLFGYVSDGQNPADILDEYRSNIDLFVLPNSFGYQYSFIFNNTLQTYGTFSYVGKLYLTLYSMIVLMITFLVPSFNLFINVKEYQLKNDGPNPEWNYLQSFVYFIIKPRVWPKWVKKDKKGKKEKSTYRKYAGKIGEQGLLKNKEESFSSTQVDNSILSVITREEIESHQPNQAFLSREGDWMYHDGNGNHFVAKADEWIPFEVNAQVHKAFVDNAVNELDLDPSKKQVKKSFFETRFKKEEKITKKTSIELPDDDLDEILKKLDI